MQKKILIADDDSNLQKLLKVNFENAGHSVVSVFDGNNTVQQIHQERPDLIILDIMLPGIDGYTICRQLREKEATILTPILILSAKDKPVDKITALKLGADDYVTKPFDIGELTTRVGSLMRRTDRILSANPLTGLPGNVSIMYEVSRRLKDAKFFSFMYLDIDNFKTYNDKYGFKKGDEVIKFTAEIIKHSVTEKDFVGHIGGDDFISICDVKKSEDICRKIIGEFDSSVYQYYDPEDSNRGYIIAKDRQGKIQNFPIMALSIGVADVDEKQYLNSYGEIVEVATEMKKYAKEKKSGTKSSFTVNKRKGGEVMEKKILVAEDDINLQTLLRVNLEGKGYQVKVADDGEKALSEFFNFVPHIIILDIVLPKIMGLDVCKAIRQSTEGKNLPILITTGVYNKLEFRVDARKAGATDVITKPFDIKELIEYIEKLSYPIESKPVGAHSLEINKKIVAEAKKYSAEKKVVIYYPNGDVLKGLTSALNPGGAGFNMTIYGGNKRIYVNYSTVLRVEVVDEF